MKAKMHNKKTCLKCGAELTVTRACTTDGDPNRHCWQRDKYVENIHDSCPECGRSQVRLLVTLQAARIAELEAALKEIMRIGDEIPEKNGSDNSFGLTEAYAVARAALETTAKAETEGK